MLSTTDKTHNTNGTHTHTHTHTVINSLSNNNDDENNLPVNSANQDEDAQNIADLKQKYSLKPQQVMVTRDLENIKENDINAVEIENKSVKELNNLNPSGSNLILVFDENDNRFTFYNSNKSILGSFNFKQILKYIGKQIDPTFYSFIDLGYSDELIKSMLGEVLIDPITGKNNIVLKSHIESPFMGNLDLLIRLNNLFYSYETKELLNDISLIKDEKTQYKLKLAIKQFIYLLINHTLKIIAIATEEIKDDPKQEIMKQKLLKYSVALTYRISGFMKEHLENYNNQYKSLYTQLEKLIIMKKTINDKIDKLEEKINKQNELIFSTIKGKTENIPVSTNIVTEKDFEKLFDEDKNSEKNNYYDSEFMIGGDSNETYLISDSAKDSDVSEII